MNYYKIYSSLLFAALCFLIGNQAIAQMQDQAYIDLIKKHTTDDRFLPKSLKSFPHSDEIPSPLEHFGTIIGEPGVMHHTQDIYAYYQILADKSDRMQMVQVKESEEGRPIQLLIISSKENLSKLEAYKEGMKKLSDPRTLDEEAARELISEIKPMYYLNGGLHSTEMGSPEMLMELAFRLVVEESAELQNIRENVITLINPVSEPDGRDKQVDWYHRYTKHRDVIDDGFRRSAPYWGKYVFHDNNRDGLQVSQALTKAIFEVFYEYHPIAMLDLHESVPLLYISTGTGPYNTYVDPISIGEWQVMANHDLTQATAEGLPGVFTWAFYNGWWPGYAVWVANNHNSIGRFYETFGNSGANTYLRDLRNGRYAGDPAHTRQWYRPDPPTEQVLWSARNNVNYMQTGTVASLSYAANNGSTILMNYYQKGQNNVDYWKKGDVFAYRIPTEQRDPAQVAYLLKQLRVQGIEVHQRTTGDHAGEYVVLLNQPYSGFADALLSKQKYPQNAKHNPYDDIAWTYGLMYGVEVEQIKDSTGFDRKGLELLTEEKEYVGSVSAKGSRVFIPYKAQQTLLPMLYKLGEKHTDLKVSMAIEEKGEAIPAGTVMIEGLPKNAVSEITDMGLDVTRASRLPEVTSRQVKLPRIGIYHTWYNTQAEGWARYTFEQRGIPYTSIDKDDLKNGDLRSQYDVIVVPHTRGNVVQMIHGIESKWGPLPYTKTEAYPHHGYPDSSPDITGGPGFKGMDELKTFVEQGGALITLANSTRMAAETGIARELRPLSTGNLFHPGSIVTAKARRSDHFIMNGYPEITHVFRGNLQLYQVGKYHRNSIVLQYGTGQLKDEKVYKGDILGMPEYEPVMDTTKKSKEPYVLSGMVRNENRINGQGAIFDLPVGEGRVIAFTFNPLHRFLNHHDAPMLWNAILNWDAE